MQKLTLYGANSVPEGVAIMWKEGVDVSIWVTPQARRFPASGCRYIQKKECNEKKARKYFSVASGGGTGRTLHPDNMSKSCFLWYDRYSWTYAF